MLVVVAACTDSPAPGPSGASHSVKVDIPLPGPNRIDILLVVDDSPMMAEQTGRVRAHVAGLAEILPQIIGGVPDVHIGVVGTSVNTGGGDDCAGTGALVAPFLADRPYEGHRETNYTGELATALDTMADLGAAGCAHPKPFEAAKRALANTAGFLRDDAHLFVLFLASGHEYSSGAPAEFAAGLQALKADPYLVHASTITATAPPQRFADLLAALPHGTASGTLAAPAPSDALGLLGQLIKVPLYDTCVFGTLADVDPVAPGLQTECTAELHTTTEDSPMKRCAPGLTEVCYSIVDDAQACPQSGLHYVLEHTDNYRVAGNHAIIECLVEESP